MYRSNAFIKTNRDVLTDYSCIIYSAITVNHCALVLEHLQLLELVNYHLHIIINTKLSFY